MICCRKKDSLSPENSSLLEGFYHLKFATNLTSSKLVDVKWATKCVSQDLVLQNYFESISNDEQED